MTEEFEFKTKAAKYRHHVLKAQEFSGTLVEYCKKLNLDVGYFYHCRSEMGLSNKREASSRSPTTPNAFTKVIKVPEAKIEISKEKRKNTDALTSQAKWLAEFVHHYLNQQ